MAPHNYNNKQLRQRFTKLNNMGLVKLLRNIRIWQHKSWIKVDMKKNRNERVNKYGKIWGRIQGTRYHDRFVLPSKSVCIQIYRDLNISSLFIWWGLCAMLTVLYYMIPESYLHQKTISFHKTQWQTVHGVLECFHQMVEQICNS